MAGMLPGVEAARRRRFHQQSNHCYGADPSPAAAGCSTRRSSLCLYVSNHDFHFSLASSTQRKQVMCDESRLGAEAREAKKRLDERLQAQWRSEATRSSKSSEVEKAKKSGSKRLKWLKLSWKSSEQEECAVCLEQVTSAAAATATATATEAVMQLPCGHRFHTHCLEPWLRANAHCPCCRTEIQIPSL